MYETNIWLPFSRQWSGIGRKSRKLHQFPQNWKDRWQEAQGKGWPQINSFQRPSRHTSPGMASPQVPWLPFAAFLNLAFGQASWTCPNAPSKYSLQSPSWPLVESFAKLRRKMYTDTSSLIVTHQDPNPSPQLLRLFTLSKWLKTNLCSISPSPSRWILRGFEC